MICLCFDLDGLYIPFAKLLYSAWNIFVYFSVSSSLENIFNPFSLCIACPILSLFARYIVAFVGTK